ncbi:MAG TPA: hypothetical protein VMS18_18865 [Candidatus Binatia bacterium]|nr:hypothetical protein [Candidatus Binatia bacterium]
MSESAALLQQAGPRLNHGVALLKASALESKSLELAREIWETARIVEEQAARVRQMVEKEAPPG